MDRVDLLERHELLDLDGVRRLEDDLFELFLVKVTYWPLANS